MTEVGKDGEDLVRKANEVTQLLDDPSILQFTRAGRSISFTLEAVASLPDERIDWALQLIKSNLYDQYVAAEDTGWMEDEKRHEISEAGWYLVAHEGADLAGFLYFQFVMEGTTDEDELPVIYCYELQFEEAYRRLGLGTYMMDIMEQIGRKYEMTKSMLTCFKSNLSAIAFYRKNGYDIDEISPSKHLSPRRAARVSYEIFSKRLI
ncbi:acyl-CoA N-acyltransferase [Phlyctochytrium arcticum]|nr:acyl-CoA N-acyltransferase [Phlyctochytrium arcticum]